MAETPKWKVPIGEQVIKSGQALLKGRDGLTQQTGKHLLRFCHRPFCLERPDAEDLDLRQHGAS